MRYLILLLSFTLALNTMARREPKRHYAPSVTVRDSQGIDTTVNFRKHGQRYLIIFFWASWCQPCHNEIPNLKQLYSSYHSQGLDIVGISTDMDIEEWRRETTKINAPWHNYVDQERRTITNYNVHSIPSIFVLNNKGAIIAEKLRGQKLIDFIDNLFCKDGTKRK